mgnify:CR=1 FL=1
MKKIYKYYCKVETIIACAGFFTIIAMTFGNAVLRLLNKPIPTSDDICTLLFAWVSFLGADIALRSNRLVSMNLVTMNLPVKVQKVLSLIVYGIMLAVLGLFVVKGYQLARMNWLRFFNTLPISYGWATLSLPVCSVLMIITVLIKLTVTVMHFKDDSFSISMHDPDNEEEDIP